MPHLVIHAGDGTSSTREIASEHLTIGSGMVNSVVLHTAPAGCKAEISSENGEYRFRNLGSQDAVTLNGLAIPESRLHDGDTLRFGDVACVFRGVRGRRDAVRSATTAVGGSHAPAHSRRASLPTNGAADSPGTCHAAGSRVSVPATGAEPRFGSTADTGISRAARDPAGLPSRHRPPRSRPSTPRCRRWGCPRCKTSPRCPSRPWKPPRA